MLQKMKDKTETVGVGSVPFEPVTDVGSLLPLIKSRLPKSGQIYNMVLAHDKFTKEIGFYSLHLGEDKEIREDTWILIIYARADLGQEILLSVPENAKVTPEITHAFTQTPLINWRGTYCSAAIDHSVSSLFADISVEYGNVSTIFPCYFYYCPEEEALALDTSHDDDVELRSFDLITGPEFIYRTWKYSIEGSMEYIRQSIEHGISSAVYNKKDGKPISGIITIPSGTMGMLYTEKPYRKKNYGMLAMQALMKEHAKNGNIPCSTCEITNEPSSKFHLKIGMKICNRVDYLRCDGPTVFK